jgi:hypothetical protein
MCSHKLSHGEATYIHKAPQKNKPGLGIEVRQRNEAHHSINDPHVSAKRKREILSTLTEPTSKLDISQLFIFCLASCWGLGRRAKGKPRV